MLVISDNDNFQFGINPDRIDCILVKKVKEDYNLVVTITPTPNTPNQEVSLFRGEKSKVTDAYQHLRKMLENNPAKTKSA